MARRRRNRAAERCGGARTAAARGGRRRQMRRPRVDSRGQGVEEVAAELSPVLDLSGRLSGDGDEHGGGGGHGGPREEERGEEMEQRVYGVAVGLVAFSSSQWTAEGRPGAAGTRARSATWCGSAARSLQGEDGVFTEDPLQLLVPSRTGPPIFTNGPFSVLKLKPAAVFELNQVFEHFQKF